MITNIGARSDVAYRGANMHSHSLRSNFLKADANIKRIKVYVSMNFMKNTENETTTNGTLPPPPFLFPDQPNWAI